MIEFTVEARGWDEQIARLENYPAVQEKHTRQAMVKSLAMILRDYKGALPVGVSGKLRSQAGSEVRSIVGGIEGVVFNASGYGAVIEDGAPGHYPNTDALGLWVKRKLGMKGRGLWIATRRIAKKIAQRGLPARPYLRTAYEKRAGAVERNFKQAQDAVVRELAG